MRRSGERKEGKKGRVRRSGGRKGRRKGRKGYTPPQFPHFFSRGEEGVTSLSPPGGVGGWGKCPLPPYLPAVPINIVTADNISVVNPTFKYVG